MKKMVTAAAMPAGMLMIPSSEVQFDPAPTDAKKRHVLGTGRFGIVYSGTYQGKPVAIKTLHSTTPNSVATLKKEAALMHNLQSPHTVSLLGMMVCGEEVSLIIERLELSLFKKIHQDQPLPWSERYRLAHEIAKGLAVLHQQEIIHRDIKSHNILLDASGHAKITDFGFSTIPGQLTSLASAEPAVGTPAYKAPELYAYDLEDSDSDQEDTPPYSPYSDIYAFGVILWELASRAIPFDGKSFTKIQHRITKNKPEPIPQDCPEAFAQLIRDCWTLCPQNRPTTLELVARTQALCLPTASQPTWQMPPELMQHLDPQKTHQCIPALPDSADTTRVINCYQISPVPGYDIARIEVIYNPDLERAFAVHLNMLERRQGYPEFHPKWSDESNPAWRKMVLQTVKDWAQGHQDPAVPHVDIVPLWYGTSPALLGRLCSGGHALLADQDRLFGKGIYSSLEASYAYRIYSKGALILHWVAMGSAYPVIDGDIEQLEGKGPYQNYDAHVIPLRPRDPHNANEQVYYPCQPHQNAAGHAVVVFNYLQCLPRYVVTLQPALPKTIKPLRMQPQDPIASTASVFSAIRRHDLTWIQQHLNADLRDQVYLGDHILTAALRCPTPEIFNYLCQVFAPSIPEIVHMRSKKHPLIHLLWTETTWSVGDKRQYINRLLGYGLSYTHPIFRALCFDDATHVPDIEDTMGYTPFHYLLIGGHLERIQWWCTTIPNALQQVSARGYTPLLLAVEKGHLPVVQWLLNEHKAHAHEKNKNGDDALLLSAKSGHLSLVQWLFNEDHAKVNKKNPQGDTALMLAAKNGHLPVVQWLLNEHKAHAHAKNKNGDDALMLAAKSGHLPVVQWLLTEGHVTVNRQNQNGDTALLLAAKSGHLPTVQWLLTEGHAQGNTNNQNGDNALLLATRSNHFPIIQWLITEGNINVNEKNNHGETALILASEKGNLPLIQWLMTEGGANVHEKNQTGNNALMLAVQNGRLPVVQWLLQEAPNMDEADQHGHTALNQAMKYKQPHIIHWILQQEKVTIGEEQACSILLMAAKEGHLPTVQWLINTHGEHLHPPHTKGQSPLIAAAQHDHLSVVQYLITEGGYDVDEQNKQEATALSVASDKGHLPLVQWLITEGGADVHIRDEHGNIPLMLAARSGHLSVVQCLSRQDRATVTAKNKNNDTALLLAAKKGFLPIVQYLLSEGGSSVREKDNNGATALILAAGKGHLPVVQWLLDDCGATVNEKNKYGQTALLSAASAHRSHKDNLLVIKWLLNTGGASIKQRNKNGATALILAAEQGNIPVVQWLLEHGGAVINERNKYGGTALLCAVHAHRSYKNNLPLVQWLLSTGGADIEENNKQGATALLVAAETGELSMVQWLLDQGGADINARNHKGDTALALAQKKSHQSLVQWFKDRNPSQNKPSDLLEAAKNGHLFFIQRLFQDKDRVNDRTRNGDTALLVAAKHGRLSVVTWLLGQGKARIDENNNNGDTALLSASRKGHLPVVQFLLDQGGSSVIETDKNGNTALLLAAYYGHLELVQWLLNSGGASITEHNNNGTNALMLAAKKGKLSVVQWLLAQSKGTVHAQNHHGDTALLLAAGQGHLPVVAWLYHQGGAKNTTNHAGQSASDLAKINNHKAVQDFLGSYASNNRPPIHRIGLLSTRSHKEPASASLEHEEEKQHPRP